MHYVTLLRAMLAGSWASIVLFAALLYISQPALAQFTQQGPKLVGAGPIGNAYQGSSVALSGDGNTAIVGGPQDNSQAGAAWVYTRSGGIWTQQGSKLVGTGAVGIHVQQGTSVLLVVGATAIRTIVAEWVAFLRIEQLFGFDDPLFPASRVVVGDDGQFRSGARSHRASRAAEFQSAFVP
jgi:hypothetical protein